MKNKYKLSLVSFCEPAEYTSKSDIPLGLSYVAAYIRLNNKAIRVTINKYRKENIEDRLDNLILQNPDFIGFQVFDENINFIIKLTKMIKDVSTAIAIFFGGRFVSLNASAIIENETSVDFIVVDEGENTTLALLNCLIEKRNNFSDIPGICYRSYKGVPAYTGPVKLEENISRFPWPARDYLKEESKNQNFVVKAISSRGCVSNCTFCSVNLPIKLCLGKRWRGRDIKEFVDEIEFIQKHYGVYLFNIMDSSFEVSGRLGLKRLHQFTDEIEMRNLQLSYKVNFRAETFKIKDKPLISRLKKSGLDIVFVGIESASENILERFNKHCTPEESLETITLLEEENIFAIPGFIMFTPYSTLDDLKRNNEFLLKIKKHYDLHRYVNILLVYKDTYIYHQLLKDNLIVENSKDNYATPIECRFVEETTEILAKNIHKLLKENTELLFLNTLSYDYCNIKSRFHNKINIGIKDRFPDDYVLFTQSGENLLNKIGDIYHNFFKQSIILMKSNWKERKFKEMTGQLYTKVVPLGKELKQIIDSFIRKINQSGVDTSKIYLKTWI